jgi:hypothetical protein
MAARSACAKAKAHVPPPFMHAARAALCTTAQLPHPVVPWLAWWLTRAWLAPCPPPQGTISARADMFALGVVMWELSRGHVAYQ